VLALLLVVCVRGEMFRFVYSLDLGVSSAQCVLMHDTYMYTRVCTHKAHSLLAGRQQQVAHTPKNPDC
jgi:hypothetical protein